MKGMVARHDHLNVLQDQLDHLIMDKDNHEIWLEAMEKGLNSTEKECEVLAKIDSLSQEIDFMSKAAHDSYKTMQHFPVVCWIPGEEV